MKNLKEKVSAFFGNIKIKCVHIVEGMDNQVKPRTGKLTYKWVRFTKFIWLLLVLPILFLVFAATMTANTTVNVELYDVENEILAENVNVAAGSILNLGTVNVSATDDNGDGINMPTETLLLETGSVGQYTSATTPNNEDIEITSNLIITSTNEVELILDENNGKDIGVGEDTEQWVGEISIYIMPLEVNTTINYSSYDIIIVNNTPVSYTLDVEINNSDFFVDNAWLGETENDPSFMFTLNNIDPSFINIENHEAVIVAIVSLSVWVVLLFGLILTENYFSKWEVYDLESNKKVKGEGNE